MRRFSVRVFATLLTFIIGIATVTIWYSTRPETCPVHQSDRRLTGSEAIRVAECFIRDNGYTDLASMTDRSKLSHDAWSDSSNTDETLVMRHDSLHSRADGILKGNSIVGGRSVDGWCVGFGYNLNNPQLRAKIDQRSLGFMKDSGKVVVMDAYGGNLEIRHTPVDLRDFQKIRRLW